MILGYVALNLALMVVLLWGRTVLVRFLRTYNSIENESVLTEFKNVARWNMYGALAFLVCGIISLTWGIFLVNQYGLEGLAVVLALSIPSLMLSLSTKKVEVQSRSLPCQDSLKPEYERVSEVWIKKALPNF